MDDIGNGRDPERFRALLRRHREARRWSQERLAGEAAIDHSLVSRLESGQRAPTRLVIRKLGAGLGLTDGQVDELLIAAGFLPDDPAATIAGDEAAVALYRFLNDENIPQAARASVRAAVDRTLSAVLTALHQTA